MFTTRLPLLTSRYFSIDVLESSGVVEAGEAGEVGEHMRDCFLIGEGSGQG